MKYARAFINSVEYGRLAMSYYRWDPASRAKFSEKQLAEALNRAYLAGKHDAAAEMKETVTRIRSEKQ
jgi:hypothetical protein